jgi:hypothetical protein
LKKINLSIVQYGGISYRSLIDLAIALDKNQFNVNYFWCHPGKDLFSNFKHIQASQYDVEREVEKLQKGGVTSVQFNVAKRFVPDPTLPWINTNFFEIFEKFDTDFVFTWKSGRSEFPFMYLDVPVVEWNVFGTVDSSPNLVKSLAISPLCRELFIKNGGEPFKSLVMYVPVSEPATNENLRSKLSIPSEAIVCGMHQRPEDSIFSPMSLNALRNIEKNTEKEIYFLILGGSPLYLEHAKKIGLRNFHQLPYESEINDVSKFLNTINIYTHARADGETLGRVIQEAMMHRIPIISHRAQWNAHIETMGRGGIVVADEGEYTAILERWVSDMQSAKDIGILGYSEAVSKYSFPQIIKKFESILIDLVKEMRMTPIKTNKRVISSPVSINYLFLVRYYGIKHLQRLSSIILGKSGPEFILKLQQFYNRTKRT